MMPSTLERIENERETTPEEASAPTRAIESERDRQPDRNEASLSERVRRHGEDREIPSTRHFDRVRDKKERSNDSSEVPIGARPLERSTPNPFSLTPSSSSRLKGVPTEPKRLPVAQRRPGFSVSTFLASQSPFQSSFYRGGTTYGGASAAGRPAVKRIKPVCNNDISNRNVGMSQTTKRILETFESIASPLEDARRIPQSVFFPSKSPVTFSLVSGLRRSRASTTRRTDHLNLSLSSSRPPPVELLKFPLSTLPQNRPVHLPEENISAKVPKTSTTCSGSDGGGKMKSPKTTAHCASVRQEERSEEHWNNECRAARRRVEELQCTVQQKTAELERSKANLAYAKARLEALTERRKHGLRQSPQTEEDKAAAAARAAAEVKMARIRRLRGDEFFSTAEDVLITEAKRIRYDNQITAAQFKKFEQLLMAKWRHREVKKIDDLSRLMCKEHPTIYRRIYYDMRKKIGVLQALFVDYIER